MITDPDIFFAKGCGRCGKFDTPACAALRFGAGLGALRTLCSAVGLEETAKWGHPCYMHAGRNIAIFGAFRDDFRLTFFNAALMKDPEGVLTKQGENTANAGVIRFDSPEDVERLAPVITRYLQEAMGYAEVEIKPEKSTRDIALPDELVEALDADPQLAEAFAALTLGRQRGYALHIGSAKKSVTRQNRIEALRPRIFAGIGYNERAPR